MALLNLVYRDQLFPREPTGGPSTGCCEATPRSRPAAPMVDLLALAHERGCEAELADAPRRRSRRRHGCPILTALRGRFAPDPAALPESSSHLTPLHAYEALLGTDQMGDAA